VTPAATYVEIRGRTFAVPLDCPCCGATPDTELTIALAPEGRGRAAADSARSVDFPYCGSCFGHVSRWESAGLMSAGVIVLGVAAGIAGAVISGPALGLVLVVASLVLAIVLAAARRAQARRAMREACSSPGRAVAYLGWTGSASRFSFQSMSYAAKFGEQNANKLVEDPKVRKLLERYKLARIAVPTPAAAVAAIPPPLDVAEWMAKLAGTPGRVARRAALVRALEVLHDPREREQVIRAVSAIELAALLAPLDRMTSTADRARHLQGALDRVRADNLPDELQEALLRELEERLQNTNR
jgi:hypothetical protein